MVVPLRLDSSSSPSAFFLGRPAFFAGAVAAFFLGGAAGAEASGASLRLADRVARVLVDISMQPRNERAAGGFAIGMEMGWRE
jgi:hypothetical protein